MKKLGRNKGFRKFMMGVKRLTEHELFRNKLYGSLLILIGLVTLKLTGDITVLMVTSLFGLPVIFAKENVIVD